MPLPEPLRRNLAAAGILITPEQLERRRLESDALIEFAGPRFERSRFFLLPSLLHGAHVAALDRYYRELIDCGRWAIGDAQVRERYGQHNETMSRYFHHQLAEFVGRISGERVKPAYAYVSAYKEGAILRPHVDRKQCVFTLSLWIDRDATASTEGWPLWFETDQGQISVTQQAGDAVLFRGCELPHWRDKPPAGRDRRRFFFTMYPEILSGYSIEFD